MKRAIFFVLALFGLLVSGRSQIKNGGININTINNEMRPVVTEDGLTMYFTVEGGPRNAYADGQDIWTSTKDSSGEWQKATRLPDFVNSQRYNGVYWCSPAGDVLLIRGKYNERTSRTERGFSTIRKGSAGWSAPVGVNVKDYGNVSRGVYNGATMATDESAIIMYFSDEKNSDMNDLWVSVYIKETGAYTSPTRIGISTEDADEISPYIATDDKTLFFSSNREGGLGSYDIWMSKRLDDTWQNWTAPVNIGAPFNTKKWDAYFSVGDSGKIGYVSTNHKHSLPSSLGGGDIAYDTLVAAFRPETRLPMQEAIAIIATTSPDTVYIYDTNYVDKIIPCDPLDTLSEAGLQTEMNKGKILFDFSSATLRSDAYRKLDVIAKLLEKTPGMKIELGGHSDAIGTGKRNLSQSQERAESAKNYLVAKGISPTRILAKGYANQNPIADNKTDAGRQLNRRVDIVVIVD